MIYLSSFASLGQALLRIGARISWTSASNSKSRRCSRERTFSLIFLALEVPTTVVVMSLLATANCKASRLMLVFFFLQCATAFAQTSRIAAGAGCHLGGPFSVSSPIANGAALMMPTFLLL